MPRKPNPNPKHQPPISQRMREMIRADLDRQFGSAYRITRVAVRPLGGGAIVDFDLKPLRNVAVSPLCRVAFFRLERQPDNSPVHVAMEWCMIAGQPG